MMIFELTSYGTGTFTGMGFDVAAIVWTVSALASGICERLSQQGKSRLANQKVVLLLESVVATKNQSSTAVLIITLLIAIMNKDYLR